MIWGAHPYFWFNTHIVTSSAYSHWVGSTVGVAKCRAAQAWCGSVVLVSGVQCTHGCWRPMDAEKIKSADFFLDLQLIVWDIYIYIPPSSKAVKKMQQRKNYPAMGHLTKGVKSSDPSSAVQHRNLAVPCFVGFFQDFARMGLLGVPYCSTLPKIFRCLCALALCMGSMGVTKVICRISSLERSDEYHLMILSSRWGLGSISLGRIWEKPPPGAANLRG